MNGLSPSGEVRSLSIGVVVKPAAAVRTAKANAAVFFAPLSANLTAEGKAALDRLVKKTGTRGVRVDVTGYVQPSGGTGNDQALSTARARTVAAYLRGKGLKGAYTVTGDGRAKESGATARRVEVRVTYQAR
jgi:outer membrane protein OmpA-like peptidoglycan-associated protein